MPDCNPYFEWYNAHQISKAATPQRNSLGQEVTTETGDGGHSWKPPPPPQPAVISKIQIGPTARTGRGQRLGARYRC